LLIKKDYNAFIKLYCESNMVFDEQSFDHRYITKDCLFVVKDLNLFLRKIKSLNCEVTEGVKSQRDHVDSGSAFLI
jgi:hypothetical protein